MPQRFPTLPLLALLFCGIYLGNASWLREAPDGELTLLAHRGVPQTFPVSSARHDTCTAKIIDKPTHTFIENTAASIDAAFANGASIVELDIRATQDGQLAVFHDDRLECRTNGKGPVYHQTLAYLQSLDIAYGYTHDNGESFPLRGLGISKIPSLIDILDQHPTKQFLINLKSGSRHDSRLLIKVLDSLTEEQRSLLMIYGAEKSVNRVMSQFPTLMGYTKSSIKCLISYELLAWSGFVPYSCRNTVLQIPRNYSSYLWGWPRAFMSRMNKVSTKVILTGNYDEFSSGIDDAVSLNSLKDDYTGIVWTNKIELLGPRLTELSQD